MPERRIDSFPLLYFPASEKRAPGVEVPMPILPNAEAAVLSVKSGVFVVDVAKLKTFGRAFGNVVVLELA